VKRIYNLCAIFGFLDYKNEVQYRTLKKLLRVLSVESEVRGKDATGIAYCGNGDVKVYKAPKPAHKLHLYFPANTKCVMAHTRMATNGLPQYNYNNHPFIGTVEKTKFALAHNGVIYFSEGLRISKSLPSTQIETDSYIAVQLIEKSNTLDFDSLKSMAETVQGSFTFSILDDKNNLFLVKGENPIFLAHFERLGLYVYTSTEAIFTKAILRSKLKHEPFSKVEVISGDILKIDAKGNLEKSKFENWYGSCFFNSRIPYSWNFTNTQTSTESSHLDELVELGSFVGVSREEISALFELGFSLFEIEQLLYEPDELREQLCSVYEEEPDFCFDY
jgi:glucosamine 6-phosphate synthetase-like amidotransferase/phosphosugar isomerase protein